MRRISVALIALGGALLAFAPSAAFAQGATDRRDVMISTAVVIVLALMLCSVGYAYRRMRGMDHPTPDELEMMGGHGDHDDHAAPAH